MIIDCIGGKLNYQEDYEMRRKKLLMVLISLCLSLMLVVPLMVACPAPVPTPTPTPVEFPTKDIRHILPWSAGGGTDIAMRGFMLHSEKYLPVSIYTHNITGAKSGVGAFTTMDSKPDGYTIGTLTWDSVITVPYAGLIPGYDLNKLEFVCTVTEHATGLAVRTDAPWKTLDEFIEDAKGRPGEITVANVGTGGVWHLPVLDMERVIGIKVDHIPYPEGAAPQREALLAGEVDAASISIGGLLPALNAGTARFLAIMGEERSPELPDVPTFKESGYDIVWGSFRVVAVPAGTPKERIEILEKAFNDAWHDEEFLEWIEGAGGGAVWRDAEGTAEYVTGMQQKAFKMIDELVEAGLLEF